MGHFNPISANIHERMTASSDPRWGQRIQLKNHNELGQLQTGFAIQGYPDDEGVRNNFGRAGASGGPDAIRTDFYGLVYVNEVNDRIYDLGNLSLEADLATRHNQAKQGAFEVLSSGHRLISLGGGHDYGYPDVAAFLKHNEDSVELPLVINFDAHLDVRSTESGLSSGTPFYRLYEENFEFDFIEIGIHKHCNSQAHFEYLRSKGGAVILYDQIDLAQATLSKSLAKDRPIFLSVDMDVFSSAYAPGVSAAWPYGMSPQEFFPLYKHCLKKQIQALGVYEVAPNLDENRKASRLAALIIDRYIREQL